MLPTKGKETETIEGLDGLEVRSGDGQDRVEV